MALVLSNNATSTLANNISAAATSIALQAGDGAKFPALAAGDWFPLTVVDGAGTLEVMRVTARNNSTLTVVRGQEGTAAAAFNAGARADLRMTRAALEAFFLSPQIAAGQDVDFGDGDMLVGRNGAGLIVKRSWLNTKNLLRAYFDEIYPPQIAAAVANLIGSAPGALDTLNELADALGDDPNFAATVTNALALKAPLASPVFTGTPTAPTQSAGDNSGRLATTAFVVAALAGVDFAAIKARANHTGTQAIGTVDGLQGALDARLIGENGFLPETKLRRAAAGSVKCALAGASGLGSGATMSNTTVSSRFIVTRPGTVRIYGQHRVYTTNRSSTLIFRKNEVDVGNWTTSSTSMQTRSVDVSVEVGDVLYTAHKGSSDVTSDYAEYANLGIYTDVAMDAVARFD